MNQTPSESNASNNSSGATIATVGRNEPCPCGSKKKYKRCCGVSAAPKLSAPKEVAPMAPGAGVPAGFDPSQMNPEMMAQMAQMIQRLPKGQVQKLQGIMKRAMAGKDVSREAAELESMLPPGFQAQFQEMAKGMGLPDGAAPSQGATGGMSVDEAKKLVAQAAAEGKISEDQAKELLAAQSDASAQKTSGISKLWNKVTRKG